MMEKAKERVKMIDFEQIYNTLRDQANGNQKKISLDSSLGVYFGFSNEGQLRLAFLSSIVAPELESTKYIKITQGPESEKVYWTCFDLTEPGAVKPFFALCENLIESVSGKKEEKDALLSLKTRYATWKILFKKDFKEKLPQQLLQGIFGELYFLKNYMLKLYSPEIAINSWSGPDSNSKDFATTQIWYEVKTIGANASEVHISSLTQLESNIPGRLVVIKVEKMADEYDQPDSEIKSLFNSIIEIINSEALERVFAEKLSRVGLNLLDEGIYGKYDVKSMTKYIVDSDFPKITSSNVPFEEITSVEYSLSVNSLKKYMEE